MSKFSDHSKPFHNINDQLPDVYSSNVSNTINDASFNKFLTRTEVERVSGLIGVPNAAAATNRQIPESTPHRQAFQLAPTMVTEVGDTTTALSFKSFLSQLDLMGVDITNMQDWGQAQTFNWVPPINMDMFVNFQDYFWKSTDPQDKPQYITIENRCNKLSGRVASLQQVIDQRGSTFAAANVDYLNDQFQIQGRHNDLFVAGFQFIIASDTTSLSGRTLTVASSSYNLTTNYTTIEVVENLVHASAVAPSTTTLLWYDTTTSAVKQYNGSTWITLSAVTFGVDLTAQLREYQSLVNCECNQTYGWDVGQFDAGDASQWDRRDSCQVQELNDWSKSNHWVHKTEITTFANLQRAQMPILEFNSSLELSEWVEVQHGWKYRKQDETFAVSELVPPVIELQPIDNYVAVFNTSWKLFVDCASAAYVGRNLCTSFTPQQTFRITDDTNNSHIYTTKSVEYRKVTSSDVTDGVPSINLGKFVTVVTVQETLFSNATSSTLNHSRIIPTHTSHGDPWLGYHMHWVLDLQATKLVPCDKQSKFITGEPSVVVNGQTIPAHADDGLNFTPSDSTAITVGANYQELVVMNNSTVRIDLLDKFRYGTSLHYFASSEQEVRVFVNGTQQLGTYDLVYGQVVVPNTYVGATRYPSTNLRYVKAITFLDPIPRLATVRIEVGALATSEQGLQSVLVRTTVDEDQFALEVSQGTQPVFASLTKYQKVGQPKTQTNQYPLFITKDPVAKTTDATVVMKYTESQDKSLNPLVGLRIGPIVSNADYSFDIGIVLPDNKLLAYRSYKDVPTWWVKDTVVYKWSTSDHAWTSSIIVDAGLSSTRVIKPVLSRVAPTPSTGSIWVNQDDLKVYQYSGSGWSLVGNAVRSDTDPSLHTIWKPASTYVPMFVDENRNPTSIGSSSGDWEILSQWKNNPTHQARSSLRFAELVTHFQSILSRQPQEPGLVGSGIQSRTQDQLDYTVGGTIKDHSGSFDTLVSAVNVSNVSPVGVIEFGGDQYQAAITWITTFSTNNAEQLLLQLNQTTSLTTSWIARVIDAYENNDSFASVFSDTTSYANGVGVKNWPATLPVLGLLAPVRPHLSVDGSKYHILHHTGARTVVTENLSQLAASAKRACAQLDPRSNTTLGIVGSTVPTTSAAFSASYGVLRPGVLFFNTSSNTLHRANLLGFSSVAPQTATPGQKYFNTTTQLLYTRVGSSWVATTNVVNDLSPIWESVSFASLIANTLFEIETRLYQIASTTDQRSMPNVTSTSEFKAALKSQFYKYVNTIDAAALPFVNVSYVPTDPWTWNYASSVCLIPPTFKTINNVSCWQQLYTEWYNTPYPHLEPWKLQGYTDKPVWWDEEYQGSTRRWNYSHATATGMWENVRVGRVPAGRSYPSGAISTGNSTTDGQVLPQYNYLSVNIADVPLMGYAPDALLPPYLDVTSIASSYPTVRSVFTSFGTEIVAPDADYSYGSFSPVEWQWSTSIAYQHDVLASMFLASPINTFDVAYDSKDVTIDGVALVDGAVRTPADQLLHGDYINEVAYRADGLNQWYTNFNRYTGYDNNGEFRTLWCEWKPMLSYQTGGIVDTESFTVSNTKFDVIAQDYSIKLVNNGVVDERRLSGYRARLLNIPPAIVQYNNQSDWRVELTSLSGANTELIGFAPQCYNFVVDTTTNVCRAFTYDIVSVDPNAKRFYVAGDQTTAFDVDGSLYVSDTANSGTYTIAAVSYERAYNRTRLTVLQTITSSSAGGRISNGEVLSWETGTQVVVQSEKFLPAPLYPDTPYYIVKLSPTTFRLAETPNDATLGNTVDLISSGTGNLTVAAVKAGFYVYGGQGNTRDYWYHYELDTSKTISVSLPHLVVGMQTLVNLFDGMAAYQTASGVHVGVTDSGELDPDTNRQVSWANEVERFINWAYGLQRAAIVVADKYEVAANASNNTLTFTNSTPLWKDGTAVIVSGTGSLPSGVVSGGTYYVKNTSTFGVLQLYLTPNTNDPTGLVSLITNGSSGTTLAASIRTQTYPSFEINASRNNVWIDTPIGVLSNVVSGPYSDIRVQQTLYDQYGRPITADKVHVFRSDKRSHIMVLPNIINDVVPSDDPYNYLHLGGGRLFVEGYEHFVLFNDYTVGNSLMYDPFLGVQVSRLNVDYNESANFTLRPNLGGFYATEGSFKRNLEGQVQQLRDAYDVNEMATNSTMAAHARSLVGYRRNLTCLDYLNVNSKSQLMFYRGLIQSKGSVNSVNAFINSRRFVDAKLDEYWAVKLADFGSAQSAKTPQLWLQTSDGAMDDIKFRFIADTDGITTEDRAVAQSQGIFLIEQQDQTRWVDHPEQHARGLTHPFVHAKVSSVFVVHAGELPPTDTTKLWFDTVTNTSKRYQNGWSVVNNSNVVAYEDTNTVYVEVDSADAVQVLNTVISTSSALVTSVIGTNGLMLSGDYSAVISPNVVVRLPDSLTQQLLTVISVTYNGTNTIVTVDAAINTSQPVGDLKWSNPTDVSKRVYGNGTGVFEVQQVSGTVVKFKRTGFVGTFEIMSYVPDVESISALKMRDVKADVTVQTLSLWDPARSIHTALAMTDVDLMSDQDPALYSYVGGPQGTESGWNTKEKGFVWVDTSAAQYLRYSDKSVYSNLNDRLSVWGKLAPWGDITAYEWIGSEVPPSAYEESVRRGQISSTGAPKQNVFVRRRFAIAVSVTVGTGVFTAASPVVDGSAVLFRGENLPDGIERGVVYTTQSITPTTFTVRDVSTGAVPSITSVGVGVEVVIAFNETDWSEDKLVVNQFTAIHTTTVSMAAHPRTLTWPETTTLTDNKIYWVSNNSFVQDDSVSLYVNDVLVESGLTVTSVGSTHYVELSTSLVLNENDQITVVKLPHALTKQEVEDVVDTGEQLVQWKIDYKHTVSQKVQNGVLVPTYYFWVANNTKKSEENMLSVYEITRELRAPSQPYFVVQNPQLDPALSAKYGYGATSYGTSYSTGVIADFELVSAIQYRDVVLRKVSEKITDDRRFAVTFASNKTQRWNTAPSRSVRHSEWVLFREKQDSNVPKQLWDKVTESVIGVKLNNSSVRVPSLDREIYDATYGSTTRYGLGDGQAFVDGSLALASIMDYLQDASNDFAPVDVGSFLAQFDTNTASGITRMMNVIYNTFTAQHVNAIWFRVLHDALASGATFPDLMKTSWIAIYGIRVLEVGGLFDD